MSLFLNFYFFGWQNIGGGTIAPPPAPPPVPTAMSSAIWPSLPKKHYNGLINQSKIIARLWSEGRAVGSK